MKDDVNAIGQLSGIVAVDDIVATISEELRKISELLEKHSPRRSPTTA